MILEFWTKLNELEWFQLLPLGATIPAICMAVGFIYGMYHLVRSYKYLYYFYIEYGEVVWWTDSANNVTKMKEVIRKHRLNADFKPYGYVGGFVGVLLWTIFFTAIGTVWPLALVIGIFSIPNLALRYVAKERRKKAIFEQTLKAEK